MGSESALFQLYLATIWLLQIPLSRLSCKVTQTHTHKEYPTKETVDPAEMTCQDQQGPAKSISRMDLAPSDFP